MPVPQQKEPDMEIIALTAATREPWNKGKLVGQKTPFKLKEIWAIRVRLQMASRCRDLALFNLAIDSKSDPFNSKLRSQREMRYWLGLSFPT